MSPRTKEQFAAIRSQKEDHIQETALRLFASHGYKTTSVSMLAREAGISKGLMYNYYSGKEDLLRKIMLGGLSKIMEFLIVKDQNKIKKKELIDFIDGNLMLLRRDPHFYKLYFTLSFQPDVFALIEDDMMEIFGQMITVFTNYYAQQGEANPQIKTRYLLAVYDGIGIHYIMDTEGFPLNEARNMMVGLL